MPKGAVMSRRAYRVVEIVYGEESSFNVSDEQELTDFFESEVLFSDSLGSDGSGMFDIPVTVLRKAIRKAKELNLSAETVERLRKDIESTRANKDEAVTYCCF
jgi:hypothetical protein